MKTLERLSSLDELLKILSNRELENSGTIFRLTDGPFDVYSDKGLTAAVAVQENSEHCIFWGDWEDVEIPFDILPKEGIFISACAPEIIEILKQHFELDGEWPCWHFLAPEGYGPGEWDSLGPLKEEEAPFVAKYWELGGDDREEHLRDRIRRFDSACIRVRGSPVAWCGLHFEIEKVGNLGFAHTLDEHRRKGYASIVTKALVNRLAYRGKRATCDVLKDNEASIRLCEAMEFRNFGEVTWAYFRRD